MVLLIIRDDPYIYIYPTSKASPDRDEGKSGSHGTDRVSRGMIARLVGIGRSFITDWRKSTPYLSGDGSRYLIFYVDAYIHTIKERKEFFSWGGGGEFGWTPCQMMGDGGRALENLAGSGPAGITQHNPLVLPWTSCLVFLGRGYLLSPPGIESDRRFCRGPIIAAAVGALVSILGHSLRQFAVCVPLSNDG